MFREKREASSLGELGVFTNLDKTMVIQDAQVFNESPLNYRKCRQILTKLLYLVYQSETLTSKEATSIFFAATKAFQCKDVHWSGLRRLTYLVIKELADVAEDVIIVTSSLTQDINSKEAEILAYKSNAIRALTRVIDVSMLAAVERFLKQAIVERERGVASAAMVSAVHCWEAIGSSVGGREVVRRWLAEIQQALNAAAGKSLTQYHALGLLSLLKAGDRMGLLKLVQQAHKTCTNPLGTVLLIRLYGQLLSSGMLLDGGDVLDMKGYLRQSGPRSEMVALEAARLIVERAGDVYGQDLDAAVSALQSFLGSAKSVVRFASLRILNDLASRFPARVTSCNQDFEALVTDANRPIATLAITALLKTGDESTVDRLVRQIRLHIGDISDEFRVVVVEAVRQLALKFPAKHESMLEFLGSVLRDEGSLEYKAACLDAILQIIEAVPEAREPALLHLCEFIEDSEYPSLTVQILHLLGTLGPHSAQPSKLIRYIYNRLVLEDALVRVAAVGALEKFGLHAHGIEAILRRSLSDADDNVRDRALLALSSPDHQDSGDLVPDLDALEEKLLAYTRDLAQHLSTPPPSIDDVPSLPQSAVFSAAKKARFQKLCPSALASPSPSAEEIGITIPMAIEGFEGLGVPFKSTHPPILLTDSRAEYPVMVRKHIFPGQAILEFSITNTVPTTLLSSISVSIQKTAATKSTAIPRLANGQTASCYVVLDLAQEPCEDSIPAILHFYSQECDPDTAEPLEDGFQDKYPIEQVELAISDFILPRHVPDWTADWEGLGEESIQTFALSSLPSLPDALSALLGLYGLPALQGTSTIDPSSPIHTLIMAGQMSPHGSFAIRCRMAMGRGAVNLELAVRAQTPAATAAIIEALG